MNVSKEILDLHKQLYPTGRVWGFVQNSDQVNQVVTRFVDAIGQPFVDGLGNQFIQIFGSEASASKRLVNTDMLSYIRLFESVLSVLNITIPDNDEFSETDASNWERVFALSTGVLTLEERKNAILRRLSYPNGVPERAYYLFLQEQLRALSFDVYVHENRFYDGAGGWDVVDPDTLTAQPWQLGIAELGAAELGGELTGLDYTIVANDIDEDVDADFFTVGVNLNQFGQAEFGVAELGIPTLLDRNELLRYSFFIGGESFPSSINVPLERKTEFRQLILKLKQIHTIAFLYINYI